MLSTQSLQASFTQSHTQIHAVLLFNTQPSVITLLISLALVVFGWCGVDPTVPVNNSNVAH